MPVTARRQEPGLGPGSLWSLLTSASEAAIALFSITSQILVPALASSGHHAPVPGPGGIILVWLFMQGDLTASSGHRLTAYVSKQDKCQYSASSGEITMDVVVTPAALKPAGTWTLNDRLGRPLGTITEVSPSLFVIDANRNSGLSAMGAANFPSLNDAMTAIARHMKGECQLSSGAR
jgi:hypothetical protein